MAATAREQLKERIDTIEESYEFMLAYAAQGLSTDEASKAGASLREYLGATSAALQSLAPLFAGVIDEEGLTPRETYAEVVEIVREDARKSAAMVRLTLAQPAISSLLVDNLNASIHIRALLTDVFLLDEIITARIGAGT